MSIISRTDMDQIRRREKFATNPPWFDGDDFAIGSEATNRTVGRLRLARPSDRTFIVHSRQDVRVLLEYIDHLHGLIGAKKQDELEKIAKEHAC